MQYLTGQRSRNVTPTNLLKDVCVSYALQSVGICVYTSLLVCFQLSVCIAMTSNRMATLVTCESCSYTRICVSSLENRGY